MSDAVFEEIETRFQQKVREAMAEVRGKEVKDFSRIHLMQEQYYNFLELFPEALQERPKPVKRTPAKKTAAKRPNARQGR